jgi:aminoglycoside phosphotransferase (APT) family kinase protein
VRDDKWRGDRVALAERLGRELARIHTIVPPRAALGFLPAVSQNPAREAVAGYRRWLDTYKQPRPALEWGLRWLDRNAPPKGEIVLCHRDFRTGNYMVDEQGLTGVLDWEFAGWGDPMEDLGWLCAKCWRFGANSREAGGVGARADFYRGYEAESKRKVDDAAVRYWEAMAHARWAVIALQQGWRHISDAERSLDLALTGRRIAELEHELLLMTAPGKAA